MSVKEKPQPKECDWEVAVGFKDSWRQFKSDALIDAIKIFNDNKRCVPPQPLPRGMRDHKLKGPLKDYRECHLEGDVLLIYKPLPSGAIKLLRVCTHNDIKGPRANALAAMLKKE